ncbi:MAG: TAT-variant-translocated molybdopterin oxidoreductase [Bacteroidota bacterium]
MSNTKKYWKGLEDLNDNPEIIKKAQREFAEEVPVDQFLSSKSLDETSTPRRDFLKFLGFTVTAASLAACEAPVRKVIPYVVKPEDVTPSVGTWYATTYFDGNDFANILVKSREGRPIKIEGNKLSVVSKGGTNARVQASVLSLYDSARLANPTIKGANSTWDAVDKEITSKLTAIAGKNGNIRLLTSTIISPSTKQIIAEFIAKYPTAKHVTYDAVSYYGIQKANELSFGKSVIPTYNFDKANVIVSLDADFLATWLAPIEFSAQYVKNRKVSKEKREMSRHIQIEANLTVTGSNADMRIPAKPSQIANAALSLYKALGGSVSAKALPFDAKIASIAKELQENKGKSLVIAGSNDPSVQVVVNAINNLLGNYGTTIDLDNYTTTRQGNDAEVVALTEQMKKGEVAALFMWNVNPVYTTPSTSGFAAGLKKVELSVSFADRADETASLAQYVCPDNHYLESWGDASARVNQHSLIQPLIYPLFNTRSAQESLLKWSGSAITNYQDYVKAYWEKNMFPLQLAESNFANFWQKALHNGVMELAPVAAATLTFAADVNAAASKIAESTAKVGAWEITLNQKTAMGNGNQGNNPWLLEMPDPISRVTWDNYITMSPSEVEKLGFNTQLGLDEKADVIEISVNGRTIKAPVLAQPGQAAGTIGIALGYGRTAVGKAGNNVGANAYELVSVEDGAIKYNNYNVTVGTTSLDKYFLCSTQSHHTLMGRDMVKETSLAEYKKDTKAGNVRPTFEVKEGHDHVKKTPSELDLWASKETPGFDRPGHFWGMAIDLNSCIGCGACVVSCQSENNIPVVGKDEIRKTRDMYWIRIDRYYSSAMTEEVAEKEGKGVIDMYNAMEKPEDQPQVVFQPVMCMHCNHAPCETVCPVIATTHSNEGLNQMTYNRCVGTKYCANNCPYKVRRFNWFKYHDNAQFDYHQNDTVGKMVLNPDVTVRSRGVMEKCSMCIQRIQEGKLNAKKDGRRVNDGEIQTACSQSCPTNAIVFGDMNDKNSNVASLKADDRMYYMLEELNTQPSVFYMTKVRNTENKEA